MLYYIRRLFLPLRYRRSSLTAVASFLRLYHRVRLVFQYLSHLLCLSAITEYYLTIYRLVFYRWREIGDITNFDLLFNLSDGVIGWGHRMGSPYNIIRPFRPSVNIDGDGACGWLFIGLDLYLREIWSV